LTDNYFIAYYVTMIFFGENNLRTLGRKRG